MPSLVLRDIHGNTVVLSNVAVSLVQRGLCSNAEWLSTDPKAVQVTFSGSSAPIMANVPVNVLVSNE